jgi:hypothetical protein
MPVLIRGVVCCGVLAAAAAAAQTAPSTQEKFLGHWKLDLAASKLKHAADSRNVLWRAYAADGDKVKVTWGAGLEPNGEYSARCDGTREPVDRATTIRCRQVDANTMEGEQLDSRDRTHRYYRREVSPDGRTMTITWYSDARRTRPIDRLVYTRE